jgi:hypothetical protein
MADEISAPTGSWWRATYGMDSEIAHPRMKALAIQVSGEDVGVGPVYDEDLAYYSFARLLLGLARMADVLAQTVDFIQDSRASGTWTDRLTSLKDAIGDWYDDLADAEGAVVEARSDEPPVT